MIDYMEYTDNTKTKKVYEEYGLTLEEALNLQKYNLEVIGNIYENPELLLV
jgi:hypothetical protein